MLRFNHSAQFRPIDGPNRDGNLTNAYPAVPSGHLCESRAFGAVEAI